MVGSDEAEVEAARHVAARFERWYRLEPGSLLAIAWMGAMEGARRCRSLGKTELLGLYRVRGAEFAVRKAIDDGELDGSRRLGNGRRSRLRSLQAEFGRSTSSADAQEDQGWQPAARPDVDPAARLDVATLLAQLTHHLGERTALIVAQVDGEGRSQRQVAGALRVSAVRVSQLRARAHRLARRLASAWTAEDQGARSGPGHVRPSCGLDQPTMDRAPHERACGE